MPARLIAASGIRQVAATLRADAAANAAERAIRGVWADALRLARGRDPFAAYWPAVLVFRRLDAREAVWVALRKIAVWGYRSAASNLRRWVPKKLLRVAAGRKRGTALRAVREADDRRLLPPADGAPFSLTDLLAPWREPEAEELSDAVPDADLSSILFPAPDESWLDSVVRSSGWEQRLAASTSLASPETLASILVGGIAAGKNPREIAVDLLPAVDGVASTARRVARTEALRVANASQMEASEGLGDIVSGYQIVATLDAHTRPEHAARNGTTYWRNPRPGQLGFDSMPRPPAEADGSIAWNCRCFLRPVLTDPGEDIRGQLDALDPTPDYEIYSSWFGRASHRERVTAVGARRHSLVTGLTRTPRPSWETFLDVTATRLLSVEELAAESPEARRERIAKVRAALANRGELLAQTSRYGAVIG